MQLDQETDVPLAHSASFEEEATTILADLKSSVADVLSALGGIRRPIDLKNLLELDRTLAWQLYKVATSENALTAGGSVPSRVSIEKFAKVSRKKGVQASIIQSLMQAYKRFEELVTTHSDDRVSFNSMISAVSADEEWQSADIQHRRNIYRGISHATGIQAKALLKLNLVNKGEEPGTVDAIIIQGAIDIRLLSPVKVAQLVRMGVSSDLVNLEPSPLFGDSFLMKEFCDGRFDQVEVVRDELGYIQGNWIDGPIGNRGKSSFFFGAVRRGIVVGKGEGDRPHHNVLSTIYYPAEMAISDILIAPGLFDDWTPKVQMLYGLHAIHRHVGASEYEDHILPSKCSLQRIGVGPPVTAEVPGYIPMLLEAAKIVGWDISTFSGWRARFDFPIPQTSMQLEIEKPQIPKS